MSAFICHSDHFKALAIFAASKKRGYCSFRVDPRYIRGLETAPQCAAFDTVLRGMENLNNQELATLYANILLSENIRSVSARYPNESPDTLPGPIDKDDSIEITSGDFASVRYIALKSIAILKMCDCLEYQSCETDDYENTVAYALLNAIRRAAIRSLPGYEDAPWEYVSSSKQAAA